MLPTVDQLKEMLAEEERRANMTLEERKKEFEEMTNRKIDKQKKGETEREEREENNDLE